MIYWKVIACESGKSSTAVILLFYVVNELVSVEIKIY